MRICIYFLIWLTSVALSYRMQVKSNSEMIGSCCVDLFEVVDRRAKLVVSELGEDEQDDSSGKIVL